MSRRGDRPPMGLHRSTLAGPALFFFAVSASAPMAVLAGGIVAAYTAGPPGIAVVFLVLTAAMMLCCVGYTAMSANAPHAGPLYAQIARGLGAVPGVGAGAVALLCYNAINICLYGLLGATAASLLGGAWWVWAVAAWAVVAGLGVLHVRVNARIVAVLVTVEIAMVVLFDLAAFTRPAAGALEVPLVVPHRLVSDSMGGLFALGATCFIGYETAVAYGEEARTPAAVARASYGSLVFLGVFYAVTAWAYGLVASPDENGAALIFDVLADRYGRLVSTLGMLLLVTSVFAAALSFHHTAARYAFAMAREGLLPARLSEVGRGPRGGAPAGASTVQSGLAIAVIVVYALAGADPVGGLFTQLAAIAAIGITALMAVACLAALRYFHQGGGGDESVFTRVIAPGLGVLAVGSVLVVMATHLDALVGGGGPAGWVPPAVVALVAVGGLGWGLRVRRRAGSWRAVGEGEPEPLAELEHHLADVQI